MNKKFLFIELSIGGAYYTGINNGIAFLVPIAKRYCYEVACLNVRNELGLKEFRDKIHDFQPSIVGFSCTSHQIKYVTKYSRELEKYPEILQIAGGTGPTLDPEPFLKRSDIKGVCVGEGEIPFDRLLKNIENKKNIFNTEGFYWKINGKIRKNPIPQFVSDLTALDLPGYTVFGKDIPASRGKLLLTLSRGCPYNCAFCCNLALKSIYPSSNGHFRVPSVEYSIKILQGLIKQYPKTAFIAFEDDLLITRREWFEAFAKEYKKKINFPYRLGVRVEYVTPKILKTLKASGCKRIYLGIESGNEHLRSKLLNKKFTNKMLIKKCKMIKKAKLELYALNIIGFPFETKKQMQDTLRINKKIAPTNGECTFCYPYTGTEIHTVCKNNKLLKSAEELDNIPDYNTKPCIRMSAQEERDCIYFRDKILHYLYKQREMNAKTAHLPFAIKQCYIICYRLKETVKENVLLYKVARALYRLSGIKKARSLLKKSFSYHKCAKKSEDKLPRFSFSIDTALEGLRRPGYVIPDERFLEFSPIETDYDYPITNPLDRALYNLASEIKPGIVLAIDLDDTLLTNSYICSNEWQKENPGGDSKYFESIRYNQMRHSLYGYLKYARKLPKRSQYDSRKYTFLKNPQVISQLRPGMLQALKGFKETGAILILISATARKRMNFLLTRLPILKRLFSFDNQLCIITAEDILKTSYELLQNKDNLHLATEEDRLSLSAHINRPMSLAAKTPYLIKRISGISNCDILIDDSNVTFELFKAHNLQHKIVKVNPRLPHTSYALDIIDSVLCRLNSKDEITDEVKLTEKNSEIFDREKYPYIRFEDPLYYPLIHMRDQVEA